MLGYLEADHLRKIAVTLIDFVKMQRGTQICTLCSHSLNVYTAAFSCQQPSYSNLDVSQVALYITASKQSTQSSSQIWHLTENSKGMAIDFPFTLTTKSA